MTSRRADTLAQQIAHLQRKVDELDRRASRQGHGHFLAYAAAVADQTGITSETDLTGLSVSVTHPAGRRIRVVAGVSTQKLTNDGIVAVRLYAGVNQIQRMRATAFANAHSPFALAAIRNPSAGAVTYKVTVASSTASVSALAASTEPNFILVEDLGPA